MTEVGLGFCKIPLLIVVVKIKEELDIPEKTIDLPQFTDKLDPHPLDIPEKTIDLPQFTDKLDLINWTSLRKPSTCHSSLTNLISSTGHL